MRGGFRTAAGREAQRPARWAKHEAWAPTPAGAKAEAEDARTRRPAADAATARMAVGCLRTLLLGVRSSRCAVRVRGSSVRDALAPGFDVSNGGPSFSLEKCVRDLGTVANTLLTTHFWELM